MAYTSDQIQTLDFFEAVRRRPGMYIGDTNKHGLHHLALEVIDNAVDECLEGSAKHIEILIAKNGAITVIDDGRGIPMEYKPEAEMSTLTQVLTQQHSGGKFDGSAYSASGGLHGIGLKCCNAFSTRLVAEVSRYGVHFRQVFVDGGLAETPVEIFAGETKIGEINAETELVLQKKPQLLLALKVKGQTIPVTADPELHSGTKITFRPNRAWFAKEMEWADPENNVPWDTAYLDNRLAQIAFLNPGVSLTLTDKRAAKAEQEKREYYSKRGLLDYMEEIIQGDKPLHKPIEIRFSEPIPSNEGRENATLDGEIVLQYTDGQDTEIVSFVNNIPTSLGGTHVTAFKTALTRAVKAMAKLKPGEDFKGDDVLLGLSGIVKITLNGSTPQFSSQTKESLTSPEVSNPIHSHVYSQLGVYLDKHKDVCDIIVKQAVAAAHGREAAFQARKLMIKKSAMDAGDVVLGKLADLQRRGGSPLVPLATTGLYLVEGDSAGGSAKQGRHRKFHAILPLRGKIPNLEKKVKVAEILKNKEIAAIVAAVGAGIGSDFDTSQMRYGRIVILTDADVDGKHIASLLVTMFWRLMRPMIEAGRLFVARPPLYMIKPNRVKSGGPEFLYAYSDSQKDEIVSKMGGADAVHVQRYKGLGEMNPEQLSSTVFTLPEQVLALEKNKGKTKKAKPAAGEEDEDSDDVLSLGDIALSDFAQNDFQVTIEDAPRIAKVLEEWMGNDSSVRQEKLMNTDWSAVQDD
jgi:DNA gyrase subunit B